MRIVTTIASATEIVCALGLRDHMVGRSHECDHPASVTDLPICTEPKFAVEGSSYDIDQRVKAIVQEALSVYRVDAEKLRALQPDVIITQIQCEVCAVSQRDVEEVVGEWLDDTPRIISLSAESLEGVWRDIRTVAEALEVREEGERLLIELQDRIAGIHSRATKHEPRPTTPTVATVEWIDPLMASGNWMPELIELAGGINLFGQAGKHAPWMKWEEVLERDPDVLLVLPCGFDIPRTLEEMPILVSKPGWKDLKAVREDRVHVLDGNQYFNRPGPRLVESLEILAEILHPDQYDFGHQGNGWQRYVTGSQ